VRKQVWRHVVVLTDDDVAFFREHCAGRAGSELMFVHFIVPRKENANSADEMQEKRRPAKSAWKKAEQIRPMQEANERAKLKPPITFHGLRHTWASLAVMGGVPLMVVAKNLGHANTIMVKKHYGHLAPNFVADAIRANAPRFGFKPRKIVAVDAKL
jgi:integrase